MAGYIEFIRDVIELSDEFIASLPVTLPIRLFARIITLRQDLNLKGRTLELYASTFSALNGAMIYNRGITGNDGKGGNFGGQGANGTRGHDGQPGVDGVRGTDGGMVTVIAATIDGLAINAAGGNGGRGGSGGQGGKGGNQQVFLDVFSEGSFVQVPGGGTGGTGGAAGNGGDGGNITIRSINSFVPSLDTALGGAPGEVALGGIAGEAGDIEWVQGRFEREVPNVEIWVAADQGTDGTNGAPGVKGQDKPHSIATLTYEEFWASLSTKSFAVTWARYRHSVGEFYFRSYIPGVSDRDYYIGMAVDEFKVALLLDPNQTESSSRLQQIWNNMNPLGLPRDLDIIPDFNGYEDKLTRLTTLVQAFASIGDILVLDSSQQETFRNIFISQRSQSSIRVAEAEDGINESSRDEENIRVAMKELDKMIADVQQRIKSAEEEMKGKLLSFKDVAGNVFQFATAVSAVMAAAPTGGASLLVLAPDIMTFGSTVYDKAAPIVQAILDDKKTESLTKAKEQYSKVKADVDAIGETSKKVTELLGVIDKMRSKKTADNSKVMDLVLKGAELAYDYMLKNQELSQAKLRREAFERKKASELVLLSFHNEAIDGLGLDAEVIRNAGLKVMQAAFSQLDVVLTAAFYVQRSIEIYLLIDQARYVYFDAGWVHPDVEAELLRQSKFSQLIATYAQSRARLLDPAGMSSTYQRYFTDGIRKDIHTLDPFHDDDIEAFRSTFTLTFDFDAAKLPRARRNTKIQAIGISFIGAIGQGGIISCKIEHGSIYSERIGPGDTDTRGTALKSRYDIIVAETSSLHTTGFNTSSPPLDERQSLMLWGMGIGGRYTITIQQNDFEEHGPSFEGLKNIQVWLAYQFLRIEFWIALLWGERGVLILCCV